MFYLAEGLYLFRRTWWAQVRLWLLSLGFMGLFVVGIIAVARGREPGPMTAASAFLFVGLVALRMIVVPAELSAVLVIMSSPYYEARPAVWQSFLKGFRKWWTIVGVLFILFMLSLPLLIPVVLIAVRSGVRISDLPAGTRWLLQAFSPIWALLYVYGTFAILNVVRLGHRARAAWRTARRLVPSQDWLRTVGVLAGAAVLFGLADEAVNQGVELLTPTAERYIASLAPGLALVVGVGLFVVGILWALPSILLKWYLMLCGVAVWHRYAPPPETAPLVRDTPGNDVTIAPDNNLTDASAPDITGPIRA